MTMFGAVLGFYFLGGFLAPTHGPVPDGHPGGPSTDGHPGGNSSSELIEFGFPVELDQIDYSGGGLGPFGVHRYDHTEGCDHVWLYCKSNVPVRAPADGVVIHTSAESVLLKHSERFYTEFGNMGDVLVKVGDSVAKNQPVGYPSLIEVYGGTTYFFDYWLVDMERNDGPSFSVGPTTGSRVSPYEYLAPSLKSQVENAYYENMYLPYKENGVMVGQFTPYEPNLTNEIFLHPGHENTPVGVWISLDRKWEKDGVPDIVTILEVNNEFYSGYHFGFLDGWKDTTFTEGNCEIDLDAGEITFYVEDYPENRILYGIFEITENERASMRLEYREGSRPESFSDSCLNFVVRSRRSPRDEVKERFPDLPTL